ncbi:MAG: hypothetical protein ACREN8_14190, partial [Candidatus Dormibacteraceae bacterium]
MKDFRGFLRGRLWGAPRLLWAGGVLVLLVASGGFLAVHFAGSNNNSADNNSSAANHNNSSGSTIPTELTGSTIAPIELNPTQGPITSANGQLLYQLGPGGALQSVATDNPQQVQTVVPNGVTYFAAGPQQSDLAYVRGHTVYYGDRHRDFDGSIIRICFDSDKLVIVTTEHVVRFDDGSVVFIFPAEERPQAADFDFDGNRLAYLGGDHDLRILDLV